MIRLQPDKFKRFSIHPKQLTTAIKAVNTLLFAGASKRQIAMTLLATCEHVNNGYYIDSQSFWSAFEHNKKAITGTD